MKIRSTWTLVFAVAVVALVGAPVLAFHDSGVAHCNGCHTMHNSADNPADTATGNQFLLRETNSTDTCLRCHGKPNQYGNSWGVSLAAPGKNYGGGNFIFLSELNLNDGHNGGANPILGHQAGHNVLSDDFGVGVDPVNTSAPGATGTAYSSSYMHCTSCHDPHGKEGSFRILYGNVYPESQAMGYSFNYANAAPVAAGIGSLFGGDETDTNHSAYNSGMSEWCGNCHGDYHNTSYPTVLKHPSGAAIGANVSANYNAYMGTGNYVGDGSAAYLAMVPFEDPAMTTAYAGASSGTSRVMCLSCHRAHASSGPNAGRWDFNVTIWDEEGVESGSYAIPNPYPTGPAGGHQRSACNKCHAKDPL